MFKHQKRYIIPARHRYRCPCSSCITYSCLPQMKNDETTEQVAQVNHTENVQVSYSRKNVQLQQKKEYTPRKDYTPREQVTDLQEQSATTQLQEKEKQLYVVPQRRYYKNSSSSSSKQQTLRKQEHYKKSYYVVPQRRQAMNWTRCVFLCTAYHVWKTIFFLSVRWTTKKGNSSCYADYYCVIYRV